MFKASTTAIYNLFNILTHRKFLLFHVHMSITSRFVRGYLHRLRGIASVAASGTPFVPAIPETVKAYGHTWRDDYHWMQSKPLEIERILRQEAEHFRHVAHGMSSIAAISSQFLAEIKRHLPHQAEGVGEVFGGWEYASEQSIKHPMPIYYRRCQLPPSAPRQVEEKEILLDVNKLSELYGENISIGQIKLSKCGNLVACTIAKNGIDDLYSVLVRDIKSGNIYEQPALNGVVSIEWDGDNKTLLATQPDELGRPARVVSTSINTNMNKSCIQRSENQRHQPPSSSQKNTLRVLYEEKDPRFFLELQRTKDWKYLMINANSKTSSEVHILPTTTGSADDGASENSKQEKEENLLACVQPRRPNLEYFVEHLDGTLYIISNARSNEHNYDLYSVDVNLNKKEDKGLMNEEFWTKLKLDTVNNTNAPTANTRVTDVFIEDLDVNYNGIVLYQRSRTTGKPEIEILPIDTLKSKTRDSGDNRCGGAHNLSENIRVVSSYRLLLPDYAWCITPGANADFYSDTLRILMSSPVHQDQAMDWNLKSNTKENVEEHRWTTHELDKDSCVLEHNSDEYTLEKAWAPMLSSSSGWSLLKKGGDGAQKSDDQKVPISLVYSKVSQSNGTKHPKPCLVVVYASYGINLPTEFLLERLFLLKKGWTLALVHARGGGELGRQWHAAGRGPEHKPNSALDVESAVDYLMNSGYAVPGSIALEATSAGAVAAAGVVHKRPELFGAVVLESPFVDVLSTMIDPELPLTVHEYEEFGDPSTEQGMQGLMKICPYYNIQTDVDKEEEINKKDGKMDTAINSTEFDQKGKSSGMYPPVLITCSSTDARVPIWGPLKFAAKLRAAQSSGITNSQGTDGRSIGLGRGSVLVYADAHEGHLADDREKYDLKAVQYAFLIACTNAAATAAAASGIDE